MARRIVKWAAGALVGALALTGAATGALLWICVANPDPEAVAITPEFWSNAFDVWWKTLALFFACAAGWTLPFHFDIFWPVRRLLEKRAA